MKNKNNHILCVLLLCWFVDNSYASTPSKIFGATVLLAGTALAIENLKTDVSLIDYPKNRSIDDKALDKKSFIDEVKKGKIDYPVIRVSELD